MISQSNRAPKYFRFCGSCNFNYNWIHNGFCKFVYDERTERQFLEELRAFYVSVTRSKKEVYFSSSQKRIPHTGGEWDTYVCCMLSLPGIET